MVIVLVKDLYASDLGLPAGIGLIHGAGARLDTLLLLPNLENKLLSEGFAVSEEEWQKRRPAGKAKRAPSNKRGRGAREDKAD